ncbi:MAG: ABC transporter permease [Saprospiraceae bacterium]
MVKHYLKAVFRSFSNRKAFSGLNLLGLTLGVSAFLIILEFVSYHWSFNQFNEQLPQIHRMLLGNGEKANEWVPPMLAPAAKEIAPQIQSFARIMDHIDGLVQMEDPENKQLKSFKEAQMLFADGSLFDIFSLPFLQGEKPSDNFTVALSQRTAQRYFGDHNPVGAPLTLHSQFGEHSYTVSGIYQDMPANSDYHFDLVFSLNNFDNIATLNGSGWALLNHWGFSAYKSFVLLAPGQTAAQVEPNLQTLNQNLPDYLGNEILLQPLSDVHLGEGLNGSIPSFINVQFLYLLLTIALLIIGIAWINYVNLSTAIGITRAKEVSVRKVVGAGKGQLLGQFLGEALLMNGMAIIGSVFVMDMVQPFFNQLVGLPLSLKALFGTLQMGLLGLLLLIVGILLSGGYVAYFLARRNPIEMLKGKFMQTQQGQFFRKGLLVFQFVISISLIAFTIVVYQQLHFVRKADLGFHPEQLMTIKGPETNYKDRSEKAWAFRQELEQLSFVMDFCNSGSVPGQGYNLYAPGYTRMNPDPGDDQKTYAMMLIDDRYFQTYDINLLVGRNFETKMLAMDWYGIKQAIINEKAVEALGFASAAAAIGQFITRQNAEPVEVIGVVKNYHHESLHNAFSPTIFLPHFNDNLFTVKISAEGLDDKLASLGALYSQLFPGNPFVYHFIDKTFDQQYAEDQRFGWLFTAAASLAIFIACLGLFGLSLFTVEQRSKEIGIRRVLGASAQDILALLNKDYVKLLMLALGLATPLAWFGADRWLQDFAYQTAIQWWLFPLAGGLTLALAFTIVSVNALRKTWANPVETLRDE